MPTSHGAITGENHVPYNWTYADAAARAAATGMVPDDVGKLSRQLDDNTLWMLTDDSPVTWVAVSGAGASYTDEQAQDAVGTILTDSSSIDFTYTDATPEITAIIKDEYLMDWLGALVVDSTNIDITYDDGANTFAIGLTAAARTKTFQLIIDGGGSAITTGIKGDIGIDVTGAITRVRLLGHESSGSIVLDLWLDDFASFPPTIADTITASAKPTISAAQTSSDSTLTGWTTAVTAGDTLRVNVDSVATFTRVTLWLTVVATA